MGARLRRSIPVRVEDQHAIGKGRGAIRKEPEGRVEQEDTKVEPSGAEAEMTVVDDEDVAVAPRAREVLIRSPAGAPPAARTKKSDASPPSASSMPPPPMTMMDPSFPSNRFVAHVPAVRMSPAPGVARTRSVPVSPIAKSTDTSIVSKPTPSNTASDESSREQQASPAPLATRHEQKRSALEYVVVREAEELGRRPVARAAEEVVVSRSAPLRVFAIAAFQPVVSCRASDRIAC